MCKTTLADGRLSYRKQIRTDVQDPLYGSNKIVTSRART